MATVRSSAHRQFLVARGSIDQFEGTARREDILELRLAQQGFDLSRAVRRAEVVQESVSVLSTLQLFQQAPMEMAVVVDEYGDLKGIVTQTDLLEAIAGQIPDADEQGQGVAKLIDGAYHLEGRMSIYDVQAALGLADLPEGSVQHPRRLPPITVWANPPHRRAGLLARLAF